MGWAMGEARAARGRSSRETAAAKRIVTVVTMGMSVVWEIRGGTEDYIGTGGIAACYQLIRSAHTGSELMRFHSPLMTHSGGKPHRVSPIVT